MRRRLISRSLGRKLAVTGLAVVGFVLLYEVSMFDLRQSTAGGPVDPTRPAPGARLAFTATAYCKGTTTTSGVGVRTGIAASDPAILPVGSVVNVSTDIPKYNGVYTLMDTGPKIQGRLLDIYMWSCNEALAFGRKPVDLTVLRLGWNPSASTPSLIDRLFRRREATRRTAAPPPAAPVEPAGSAPVGSGAFEGTGTTVPFDTAIEPILAPSRLSPSDAPSASSPTVVP